jgi:predicted AlkP superfamily pyrophosphatase or phosphodiesterase
MPPQPVLPDYAGANVRGVLPALLAPSGARRPEWIPSMADADQVVLLVLDGLGWEQLQLRASLAPTLAAMAGGPIGSVAPTTTATALTSITTGLTPGEHGLLGYRIDMGRRVLNTLRWHDGTQDLRAVYEPRTVQPFVPFLGEAVPVVTKAEFQRTGFTDAHLRGAPFHGWRSTSSIPVIARRCLDAGHRLVYAYYDGIDKIAHERGFGDYYDAELVAADRLVADVLAALPPGAALLVTADHGQVQVDSPQIELPAELMRLIRLQSGEGRFRWLHAKPGREEDLLALARSLFGEVAWVWSRRELVEMGVFGPHLAAPLAARLGDVALVPFADVSFHDPGDTGSTPLVCRHGSLTSAEMLVPLVGAIN